MYIVSACLAGINCRFDGTNRLDQRVKDLVEKGGAVPVCPEQLGGLASPRAPAEIQGGSGEDVLEDRARVIDRAGKDVTDNFKRGAYEVLKIAEKEKAKKAILKSNSPSCGSGKIYNGTFSGSLSKGCGVTAALLKKKGIKIETERKI